MPDEIKLSFTIEEVMKKLEEATFMDDYFMRAFFEDNISGTQAVLRIIMDKPDLRKQVKKMTQIEAMKAYERAHERASTYEDVARDLIRLGQNALEDIANVCHLTLEQVKNLAAAINT